MSIKQYETEVPQETMPENMYTPFHLLLQAQLHTAHVSQRQQTHKADFSLDILVSQTLVPWSNWRNQPPTLLQLNPDSHHFKLALFKMKTGPVKVKES